MSSRDITRLGVTILALHPFCTEFRNSHPTVPVTYGFIVRIYAQICCSFKYTPRLIYKILDFKFINLARISKLIGKMTKNIVMLFQIILLTILIMQLNE